MNPQDQGDDQERLAVVDEVITKPLDRGALVAITEEDLRRKADRMMLEEQHFELSQRRAKMFSISGLFEEKGIAPGSQQGVARAMVKIELGESMGFSAAEALQGIYIINGQTAISSALRAGRMQAAGFDWVIQWHGTHQACKGCTLWLSRNGRPLESEQPMVWTAPEPPMFPFCDADGKPIIQAGSYLTMRHHESFLESDAKALLTTLWEGPKGNKTPRRASVLEKDNWKMSPRNMYFARASTNAQRFYAPAALSVSLMSAEEAMDLDAGAAAEPDVKQHAQIAETSKTAIQDRIAAAAKWNAEQREKGFKINKVSDQRVSSESAAGMEEAGNTHSASFAQEHDDAVVNGDTKEGENPAPVTSGRATTDSPSPEQRLASRTRDLRMYLEKLGPDAFGKVLTAHSAMSLADAASAPDDIFGSIFKALDEASRKPKLVDDLPTRKGAPAQKGFDLK